MQILYYWELAMQNILGMVVHFFPLATTLKDVILYNNRCLLKKYNIESKEYNVWMFLTCFKFEENPL